MVGNRQSGGSMATLLKRRFVLPPKPIVMKFGGTSVGSPAGWKQIVRRIRDVRAARQRSVVVLSALCGVTDLLGEVVHRLKRAQDVTCELKAIAQRHGDLAAQLDMDAGIIVSESREMLRRAAAPALEDGEPSLRVLAVGEQLVCAFAQRLLGRHDFDVSHRPSTKHLVRTSSPGAPHPRFELRGCRFYGPTDTWLMEGFSVGTTEGGVALLGRGGSDQSATIVAELVGAGVCEIWSDVDGFYTDDPRRVATARRYATLSYDAAESLALQGAKVIQAEALEPARRAGIPVVIKSTFAPEAGQTVISGSGGAHFTFSLGSAANVAG